MRLPTNRLANLYFLVTVLLQLIPGISPYPIYTSVLPVVFILSVSAIKEVGVLSMNKGAAFDAGGTKDILA